MGNSKRPWVILNIDIRSPWIRDGNDRIGQALGELLHTGQAKALSRTSERTSAPFPVPPRRGIGVLGCFNSIFKMWPHKHFLQREKNAGDKDHEGSFRIRQHPTGFIGSVDDIISTDPGV